MTISRKNKGRSTAGTATHKKAGSVLLGQPDVSQIDSATRREWLVTNGTGGYASGTVSGIHTRRYHGHLVAALDPPLGRTLVLSKVEETVIYRGASYELGANRWADDAVSPRGYERLVSFRLEGTTPVWRWAVADALIEKRLWLEPGRNTVYVRYDVVRAAEPLSLSLGILTSRRDHHATLHGSDGHLHPSHEQGRLFVRDHDGHLVLSLLAEGAMIEPQRDWHRGLSLAIEAERGFDAIDDVLLAGTARLDLAEGRSVTLVATTELAEAVSADGSWERRLDYDRRLLHAAGDPSSPAIRQLVLAADQFVVARPTEADPSGKTVIAGYPWFGDWGRDTMIALPDVTWCVGQPEVAASVLLTFERYLNEGMLPNRFPDSGADPEYNTADATLWYFEAVRGYVEATGDTGLANDLIESLIDVVKWHVKGTRHGIQMDAQDHLLRAGEPGVQLTWMDARVEGREVTPRLGKPVEINALWYNALRILEDMAAQQRGVKTGYEGLADRVQDSMQRYWDDKNNRCFDVIDGSTDQYQPANDSSFRPNQLLAVSLPHSALTTDQQRAVVDACAADLYTPVGLRSLSPIDSRYRGRYEGGPAERDGVYHQGTAWGWLIGPFVAAHLRVYREPDEASAMLQPLLDQLTAHGLGTLSEIFDGDPPYTPRGCIAQAWSVSEVIRAWRAIEAVKNRKK